MDTDQILENMMAKVDDFQKVIQELPYHDGELPRDRMAFRIKHFLEEIGEIMEAYDENQPALVVDGLVDLAYLVFGTILEHGVNPLEAFNLVHDANMLKERGMTKRGAAYDAVKPEGWTPPDHAPMLARIETLNQVSEVFVRLTELRIRKGKNYNRGTVKRADHFPLGHLSYFQMIWVKSIRIRSLVESLNTKPVLGDPAYDETVKLIDRELNDLMAYGCFWSESINGLDVER